MRLYNIQYLENLLLNQIFYSITSKHKLYYPLLFLMQTSILGVFCAKDVFLMFFFWLLELIPTYFLILIYGEKSILLPYKIDNEKAFKSAKQNFYCFNENFKNNDGQYILNKSDHDRIIKNKTYFFEDWGYIEYKELI